MGKPSPKYTAEFKQRTVQLCNERGVSAEVARKIGVDLSTLADWVRMAAAAALDAEANPFQMAEDLRRLRRENERFKRENGSLTNPSETAQSGPFGTEIGAHLTGASRARYMAMGRRKSADSDIDYGAFGTRRRPCSAPESNGAFLLGVRFS